MEIYSERLILYPLKSNEIELLIKDKDKFESKLNCIYDGEEVTFEFETILRAQLEILKPLEEQFPFVTFWIIKIASENKIIGSISIKNKPSKNASVEIGYGIKEKYRGKGYMQESVKFLCDWIFENNIAKNVIAETEKENLKSQNVLFKNNFKFYHEDETLWWILESNL